MPELPEVETITRNLREGHNNHPSLLGRYIETTQVLWHRSIALPSVEEFIKQIQKQQILNITRRGKFLCFSLSSTALLIHLRMSGDIWLESINSPIHHHHRVIFQLTEKKQGTPTLRLAFNDARKFGRLWLTQQPAEILDKLGPEPLAPNFTAEELYHQLQQKKRSIKPLIMEQTFIAGLGNIYADEALFLAGLHPLTTANKLSFEQCKILWQALRTVLEEGILHNGASIDWVYRGGNFQKHFRVYQRQGKPCVHCHSTIQRMIINQRSSYYCPQCQKLP